MKWQFIRALGFIATGAIISLGINAINYRRYWDGTIQAVQTVDFNILSHSLPTKLSELLIQQNTIEINRTVNSNYGLFRIVVTNCTQEETNCSGQNILYASESYYDDNEIYDPDEVTLADIQGQPFNILRDPPPLYPEWKFETPNSTELVSLNLKNSGKPIGRVYYLRNSPPTFISDLIRRFTIESLRDLLHIYVMTLGLCVTSFLLIWFFLEKALKNNREKKLALESKAIAERNLSKLRRQYLNIVNNKESVIRDYQQKLQESSKRQNLLEDKNNSLVKQLKREEYERKNLETKVLEFESTINDEKENKLSLELLIQSLQAEIIEKQTRINQSEHKANKLQKDVETLITQKEAESDRLQNLQNTQVIDLVELEHLQKSLAQLQKTIEQKEIALEEERRIAQAYKIGLTTLEFKLQEYINNITRTNSNIQEKEQELEDIRHRVQKQVQIIQATQIELNQLKDSEQTIKTENERLQEDLKHLQKERKRLIEKETELDRKIIEIQNSSSMQIEASVQTAVTAVQQEYESYFNEIVEENEELSHQNEDLKQQINQLRSDISFWKHYSNLDLEEEVEEDNLKSEYLDMSQYKFKIVSGHKNVYYNITDALIQKNKVDHRNIEWIKEEHLGHKIRDRLMNADFIIVLIGFGGHQETRDAINLVKFGSIRDAHLIKISHRTIGTNGERCRQYIEKEVRKNLAF